MNTASFQPWDVSDEDMRLRKMENYPSFQKEQELKPHLIDSKG